MTDRNTLLKKEISILEKTLGDPECLDAGPHIIEVELPPLEGCNTLNTYILMYNERQGERETENKRWTQDQT